MRGTRHTSKLVCTKVVCREKYGSVRAGQKPFLLDHDKRQSHSLSQEEEQKPGLEPG